MLVGWWLMRRCTRTGCFVELPPPALPANLSFTYFDPNSRAVSVHELAGKPRAIVF